MSSYIVRVWAPSALLLTSLLQASVGQTQNDMPAHPTIASFAVVDDPKSRDVVRLVMYVRQPLCITTLALKRSQDGSYKLDPKYNTLTKYSGAVVQSQSGLLGLLQKALDTRAKPEKPAFWETLVLQGLKIDAEKDPPLTMGPGVLLIHTSDSKSMGGILSPEAAQPSKSPPAPVTPKLPSYTKPINAPTSPNDPWWFSIWAHTKVVLFIVGTFILASYVYRKRFNLLDILTNLPWLKRRAGKNSISVTQTVSRSGVDVKSADINEIRVLIERVVYALSSDALKLQHGIRHRELALIHRTALRYARKQEIHVLRDATSSVHKVIAQIAEHAITVTQAQYGIGSSSQADIKAQLDFARWANAASQDNTDMSGFSTTSLPFKGAHVREWVEGLTKEVSERRSLEEELREEKDSHSQTRIQMQKAAEKQEMADKERNEAVDRAGELNSQLVAKEGEYKSLLEEHTQQQQTIREAVEKNKELSIVLSNQEADVGALQKRVQAVLNLGECALDGERKLSEKWESDVDAAVIGYLVERAIVQAAIAETSDRPEQRNTMLVSIRDVAGVLAEATDIVEWQNLRKKCEALLPQGFNPGSSQAGANEQGFFERTVRHIRNQQKLRIDRYFFKHDGSGGLSA